MTWDKFENHLLNEQLTDKRIGKLKTMFRIVQRFNKKQIDKLTRKDIEDFLNKLNRNELKKQNGQDFSGSTKADIKKFLKQYYKFLKGNNEHYPPEVSWIKSRIRKEEKPTPRSTINIKEAMKLANSFKKQEYRLMTLLLFDSGFRIDEMMSVTKKDLTWKEYEDDKHCFWIACNRSKTIIRNVPVPLFTEEIKTFRNSSYFESLTDSDLLFSLHPNAFRRGLKQNSEKMFNKTINPQALRHSSATYWGEELGEELLLDNRYGWAYGSGISANYIRRTGKHHKRSVQKVYNNEMSTLKKENEALNKRLAKTEKCLKPVLVFLKANPNALKELAKRKKNSKGI